MLPTPDVVMLMHCRDILSDRHAHTVGRAQQAEHNKKRAEKEEEDYKNSLKTRMVEAEKAREEVYGVNKK